MSANGLLRFTSEGTLAKSDLCLPDGTSLAHAVCITRIVVETGKDEFHTFAKLEVENMEVDARVGLDPESGERLLEWLLKDPRMVAKALVLLKLQVPV